jgi:Icc-related predicted phosphoesterase
MGGYRFLYVADVHGSETAYNKTVNAAKFYKVKDIVIGGDLTGKLLVPIIDLKNGKYSLDFFGQNKVIESSQLEEHQKQIRMSGYYYTVMSKEEYDECAADKKKVQELFIRAMIDTLKQFFTKAEQRLGPEGGKLYVIPGNDDYKEVAQFVQSYESNVVVPFEERVTEFGDGHQLVGLGYSNPTPWNSPREISDQEIYERLKKLVAGMDAKRTVLVVHPPPYGTIIDKAPQLKDFKPVISGGEIQMQSVGSVSVRRIEEEFEPVIGLHGHIHESGGVDYLRGASNGRKVAVFNSGSEYNAGFLRGILIELNGSQIKNHIFTRG